MSEKTWLKIKRGLLEPEHRERMGVRVWLYMHMIDIVDWETGTIEGWKDGEQAEKFGMEFRTLQAQRQQLQADGYITCEQTFQAQRIIIHNWTNPREYSGKVYNEKTAQGTMPDVTTENDGTQLLVPIQTENRVPYHIDHISSHTNAPNGASVQDKKKPDLVDGLLFYGRRQVGKTDFSFLAEHLRPLGEAFVEVFENMKPMKADYSLWRKTFMDWYERGYTPSEVRRAARMHKEAELYTKSPASISYALLNLEKEDVGHQTVKTENGMYL